MRRKLSSDLNRRVPANNVPSERESSSPSTQSLSIQNGQQLHTCSVCEKRFLSIIMLRNHMRMMHKSAEPAPPPTRRLGHNCRLCGKIFCTETVLDRHMKTMHTIDSDFPVLKCPIARCTQIFHEKLILLEHLATKHGQRSTFSCYLCKLSFINIDNVKLHMNRLHRSNTRFPFGRRDHLQRRLLSTCGECQKTFANGALLRHHTEITHSTRSRSECRTCGIDFSSKQTLERHMARYHRTSRRRIQ